MGVVLEKCSSQMLPFKRGYHGLLFSPASVSASPIFSNSALYSSARFTMRFGISKRLSALVASKFNSSKQFEGFRVVHGLLMVTSINITNKQGLGIADIKRPGDDVRTLHTRENHKIASFLSLQV